MKVMSALKRIKSGEAVMVTLPGPGGKHKKYTLKDGSEISAAQFGEIKEFLKPSDPALFAEAEPQSFVWAG